MQGSSFIDDDVFKAARVALSGLSTRQQVISQNVANIDTPGYESQTVSFEQAVRKVIESQQEEDLNIAKTNAAHLASPYEPTSLYTREYRKGGNYRADGNNVEIEVEMMDSSETVLRYQTLVQLLAKRYTIYKDIAKS